MKLLSGALAFLGILSATGILPTTVAQAAMAALICSAYLATRKSRGGISPTHAIIFLCVIIVAILNQQIAIVSLAAIFALSSIELGDSARYAGALRTYIIVGTAGSVAVAAAYFAVGFNRGQYDTVWRVNEFVTRTGLGFTQANVAGAYYLSIAFAVIGLFVRRPRLTTIVLAGVWILIQTQLVSRTSTFGLLACLAILFVLGPSASAPASSTLRWLVGLAPIALTIACGYELVVGYDATIDDLLTGRLSLARDVYQVVGIHLLGPPSLPMDVDGSYFNSLLEKGLIFSLLLTLLLIRLCVHGPIATRGLAVMLTLFVVATTETILVHPELLWTAVLASRLPQAGPTEDAHDSVRVTGRDEGQAALMSGKISPQVAGAMSRNTATGTHLLRGTRR